MACKPTYYTGAAGGKLVRLNTPIITPEELLAECELPAPASVVKALQVAALTLREDLRLDLENHPYKEQPTAPRSIWARMHAVTLAHVLSALKHNEIAEDA